MITSWRVLTIFNHSTTCLIAVVGPTGPSVTMKQNRVNNKRATCKQSSKMAPNRGSSEVAHNPRDLSTTSLPSHTSGPGLPDLAAPCCVGVITDLHGCFMGPKHRGRLKLKFPHLNRPSAVGHKSSSADAPSCRRHSKSDARPWRRSGLKGRLYAGSDG